VKSTSTQDLSPSINPYARTIHPSDELPAHSPTWADELGQKPAVQFLALHPDDPVTFTDDGTLDTHEVRFDTMLEGTDLTPEERTSSGTISSAER